MIQYPLHKITRDEHHVYTTPAGKLPSVTTILRATEPPKPSLEAWKKKLGAEAAKHLKDEGFNISLQTQDMLGLAVAKYIFDSAGKTGTQTHDLIERYLTRRPFPDVTPNLPNAHLLTLEPILYRVTPVIVEGYLYSEKHKVAGTVDCVGHYGGRLCVLDWKTKRSLQKQEYLHDYMVQCAGYGLMVKEHTNLKPETGVIGVSCETGEMQEFTFDLQEHETEFINRAKEYHDKHTKVKVF